MACEGGIASRDGGLNVSFFYVGVLGRGSSFFGELFGCLFCDSSGQGGRVEPTKGAIFEGDCWHRIGTLEGEPGESWKSSRWANAGTNAPGRDKHSRLGGNDRHASGEGSCLYGTEEGWRVFV